MILIFLPIKAIICQIYIQTKENRQQTSNYCDAPLRGDLFECDGSLLRGISSDSALYLPE